MPFMINQPRRIIEPYSTFPKSRFRPSGSNGFGIGNRSIGFFNGFLSVSIPVSRSLVLCDCACSWPRTNSPVNHIRGGGIDTMRFERVSMSLVEGASFLSSFFALLRLKRRQ